MKSVVLITGASSGLGQALGAHLRAKGYTVYGSSRRGEPSAAGFPMVALDVTDEASVQKAVAHIVNKEGRIDVLINNAGVGMGAPLEMADLPGARLLFDTNVFGIVRLCQAVLPHMRRQGGGRILNISSIGGAVGLPYRGLYCASKAAVDMLSETLRMEVKRFGIEVCTIRAGDMRTPIKSHWVGEYPAEDSVYGPSFRGAVLSAGRQVDQGTPPERVARQLERIIRSRRMRKAYVVGKPLQRLSVVLKGWLPAAWFERIIMNYANM